MGDEEDRHVELRLQVAQQVEDLRLDRDIEGRGRLVGDQEHRSAGDRTGDEHALCHAARDLMRIRVEGPLRIRDADPLEQGEHPSGRLGARHAERRAHSLDQLCAHLVGGIEVRHRLLRDVGDLLAAERAHLRVREADELPPVEADRPAGDHRFVGKHAQRGEGGLRLARAGFADQADDLPARDGEVDAAHDLVQPSARTRVGDGEIVDLEQP